MVKLGEVIGARNSFFTDMRLFLSAGRPLGETGV